MRNLEVFHSVGETDGFKIQVRCIMKKEIYKHEIENVIMIIRLFSTKCGNCENLKCS